MRGSGRNVGASRLYPVGAGATVLTGSHFLLLWELRTPTRLPPYIPDELRHDDDSGHILSRQAACLLLFVHLLPDAFYLKGVE